MTQSINYIQRDSYDPHGTMRTANNRWTIDRIELLLPDGSPMRLPMHSRDSHPLIRLSYGGTAVKLYERGKSESIEGAVLSKNGLFTLPSKCLRDVRTIKNGKLVRLTDAVGQVILFDGTGEITAAQPPQPQPRQRQQHPSVNLSRTLQQQYEQAMRQARVAPTPSQIEEINRIAREHQFQQQALTQQQQALRRLGEISSLSNGLNSQYSIGDLAAIQHGIYRMTGSVLPADAWEALPGGFLPAPSSSTHPDMIVVDAAAGPDEDEEFPF